MWFGTLPNVMWLVCKLFSRSVRSLELVRVTRVIAKKYHEIQSLKSIEHVSVSKYWGRALRFEIERCDFPLVLSAFVDCPSSERTKWSIV